MVAMVDGDDDVYEVGLGRWGWGSSRICWGERRKNVLGMIMVSWEVKVREKWAGLGSVAGFEARDKQIK
jgi:hypothetical protein